MVEGTLQGGEGFRGAHGRQSVGGGLAHGKEGIFLEDPVELFEGHLVFLPGQLLDREEAADDVVLVRQLGEEHLLVGLEVDLGQDGHFRIEAHHLGSGLKGEVEVLALPGNLKGVKVDLVTDHEFDRQVEAEEGALLVGHLDLGDGEFHLPGQFVPRILHLELGVAREVDPLIEELREGPPAEFLEDLDEVLGDHGLVAVALEVGLHAFPIEILSQFGAQHVEDPGSLRIGPEAELLHGIAVARVDHGSGVLVVPEDALGAAMQSVLEVVVAQQLPGVEQRVVGREALVEPEMTPVTAGDQVAEPLVGGLMGVEAAAAAQVLAGFREEGACGQGGQAGVLHSAHHVIDGAGVVVLVPGVGNPDFLFEVGQDLDGVPEGAGQLVLLGGGHVEGDGKVAVLALHLGEVAGHEGDEVVDVGLVLEPVKGHQPGLVVLLAGEKPPVGEGLHSLGDVADHLGGELLVGIIVAGEPVLVVLGFSLGPELGVTGRVAHFGGAEVESFFRGDVVGDGDLGLGPGRHRFGKGDLEVLVRALGGLDGLRGGHLPDVQAHCIEAPLLEGPGDRLEVEDGSGGQGALLEVGSDFELEVLDVDEAIGGVAVLRRLAFVLGRQLPGVQPRHHRAVAALEKVGFVGAQGGRGYELATKHGQGD